MARQPRKQSGTGIYRKDQGDGSLDPLSGNQIRSARAPPALLRQSAVPPFLQFVFQTK